MAGGVHIRLSARLNHVMLTIQRRTLLILQTENDFILHIYLSNIAFLHWHQPLESLSFTVFWV